MPVKRILDPKILNYDKPHRANMIRTCSTCKQKYYPRANGYELLSEYCGQPCYRKSRRGQSAA